MRKRGSKKNYFLGFTIVLAIFLPLIVIFFQQKPVYKVHAQTATAAVDIVDFMFSPATITVAPGTTITWTNMSASGSDHTTTSNVAGTVNSWDSGLTTPGQTFSFTFNTPGTYAYHCNVHTFMMGTVVVSAATTAPTATTAPAATAVPTALTPTSVAINVPTVSATSPTPVPGTVTATPTTTTTTTGSSSLQTVLLSIIALLLQLIQSLFGNL